MPDFPNLTTRTKPYENGPRSVSRRAFLPTLRPENPAFDRVTILDHPKDKQVPSTLL